MTCRFVTGDSLTGFNLAPLCAGDRDSQLPVLSVFRPTQLRAGDPSVDQTKDHPADDVVQLKFELHPFAKIPQVDTRSPDGGQNLHFAIPRHPALCAVSTFHTLRCVGCWRKNPKKTGKVEPFRCKAPLCLNSYQVQQQVCSA